MNAVVQCWVAADLWTKPIGLNHKPACRPPVNYTHHHHLLLSLKADTHFTIPQRIEGWVDHCCWYGLRRCSQRVNNAQKPLTNPASGPQATKRVKNTSKFCKIFIEFLPLSCVILVTKRDVFNTDYYDVLLIWQYYSQYFSLSATTMSQKVWFTIWYATPFVCFLRRRCVTSSSASESEPSLVDRSLLMTRFTRLLLVGLRRSSWK